MHKYIYSALIAIIALLGLLLWKSSAVKTAPSAAPVAKRDSPPVTPARAPEITLTEDERDFIEWTHSKRMKGWLVYVAKCAACKKQCYWHIENLRTPTSHLCSACAEAEWEWLYEDAVLEMKLNSPTFPK